MVTMLLALCSLPWSAGPGCSSSWPIWTWRTVAEACMFMAGITGDSAPRAVFSSLVRRFMMLGIMAGVDQQDSCCGMSRLVMLVAMHLALFFFLFAGLMMLGVMAGMDQKDSYCGMCKAGISGDTLEFPQLQFLGLPFRAAKTALHGPVLSEDQRDFAIAVHQVVQVHLSVVAQSC